MDKFIKVDLDEYYKLYAQTEKCFALTCHQCNFSNNLHHNTKHHNTKHHNTKHHNTKHHNTKHYNEHIFIKQ